MAIIRKQGKLMATYEGTTIEDKAAAHWANLVEAEREVVGFQQQASLPYADYVKTLQFIIRYWGMNYEMYPTGIQYIVDGIIDNRFAADPTIPLRAHDNAGEIAEVLLQVVSTTLTPLELCEHEKHERKIEERTVFKYPHLQPDRYEEIMARIMKAALKQ